MIQVMRVGLTKKSGAKYKCFQYHLPICTEHKEKGTKGGGRGTFLDFYILSNTILCVYDLIIIYYTLTSSILCGWMTYSYTCGGRNSYQLPTLDLSSRLYFDFHVYLSSRKYFDFHVYTLIFTYTLWFSRTYFDFHVDLSSRIYFDFHVYTLIYPHVFLALLHTQFTNAYGVATISKLLKIIALFCKRAL